LKCLLNIKVGICIEKGLSNEKTDVNDVLHLMNIFWGTRVTKLARVLLEERRFNKVKSLPNPDDLKKLNVYLRQRLDDMCYSLVTYENYIEVVEVVSVLN
ncbi:hypothetical protein, partial [Acinetobacter baumannii]|uniref:hypothetical protein n=1 Tax=Acinetobacter baumannii TaxID=470 RepID=UPI001C06C46F